jgi:hypothetical protein
VALALAEKNGHRDVVVHSLGRPRDSRSTGRCRRGGRWSDVRCGRGARIAPRDDRAGLYVISIWGNPDLGGQQTQIEILPTPDGGRAETARGEEKPPRFARRSGGPQKGRSALRGKWNMCLGSYSLGVAALARIFQRPLGHT